jgi:hypothetical protein
VDLTLENNKKEKKETTPRKEATMRKRDHTKNSSNNEKKNYTRNNNNNEKRNHIPWNCKTLLSLSLFCHIVGVTTKHIERDGTLLCVCLSM